MPVRTKSIYEAASPDDGLRVLTTQYWPRGVKREKVDRYVRSLGPSRELLHKFKRSQIDWGGYVVRYLEEVESESAQKEIEALVELARAQIVTVMCVCKDDVQCHRRLLKRLIEDRLK
jgi:uncharacterized protein YeaO (DUF488 family)